MSRDERLLADVLAWRSDHRFATLCRQLLTAPAALTRPLARLDRRFSAVSPSVRAVCLLAGAHPGVEQRDGVDLGALLAQLVAAGRLRPAAADARLTALSRQPWPAATHSLRNVLRVAEHASAEVDWSLLAAQSCTWPTPGRAQLVSGWARSLRDTSRRARRRSVPRSH